MSGGGKTSVRFHWMKGKRKVKLRSRGVSGALCWLRPFAVSPDRFRSDRDPTTPPPTVHAGLLVRLLAALTWALKEEAPSSAVTWGFSSVSQRNWGIITCYVAITRLRRRYNNEAVLNKRERSGKKELLFHFSNSICKRQFVFVLSARPLI